MDKCIVIDGNSLMNRAFYALPGLKSLKGEPCGASFGFMNMLLSLLTSERPKYLICVFDAGKHTFRHNMFEAYKGNRKKTPEDLIEQLKVVKNLLKTMGVMVKEIPEIEADDIIGSITRKFDAEFMVVSGDKDLLQLTNDRTTISLTQRGITNILKVTPEVLKKEFNLEPYQVIELKSIMGDKSDNIPGVEGIGQIGAQTLIDEYKSLDNVYANLDNLKPAIKDKLIQSKDMAYLSKQLATIKLDVDLDFALEDCTYNLPFNDEAYFILQNLGFKSMLKRKEFFVEPTEKSVEINLHAKVVEIDSNEALDEMINHFKSSFSIYYDDMSLHFADAETEYILYLSGTIFNDNLNKLNKFLTTDTQKICFDLKSLMHFLDDYNLQIKNCFDVALAIYIANEMDAEISLSDAIKLNDIVTNEMGVALYQLKEIYLNKLNVTNQFKLFSEIEMPLVEVLYSMEKSGISIDVEQIKSLSSSYHKELDEVIKSIYDLAGEEFNINSTKQVQTILFDKLNIEYKGKPSSSIEVLNVIKNKHPIVEYIIRYRKISKLISTYLDGMLEFVKDDGKIHSSFMQRTTSTGRLSSREPNLQNLPIRDDEGRLLRKMFVSSFENGTMISADYNQIELRLMANFSKDENMIADYLSGKDVHTATASKIFNIPQSEVTSKERRIAKSVNFGIIYGISAFGLSQNVGCSQKEAGEFIKKYFEVYPKISEYGSRCVNETRQTGYASTLMGRIRHIPDINSTNFNMRAFGERVAKNMPLQGSASDIIKVAMIKVFNKFKENNLKSKVVIQIHDELVVDCYPGESEIVKQILKESMESVVELTVPLKVEISEGKSLYDAK